MIKTFLALALTVFTATAFASIQDETACKAELPGLHAKLSAAHAVKVREGATAAIIEVYRDAGIIIDASQIDFRLPSFKFFEGEHDQISTEILADVRAGQDSIVVRAYSYAPFYFYTTRYDETDKLGRVLKTQLVCQIEGTFYDGEIYNHDTNQLIGQVGAHEEFHFKVELP